MHRDRVERSLLRLDRAGSFVAQHREPAIGLAIEIDGVGRCPFPLAPERLAQIVEAAVPSAFGLRDATHHDPTVRDSREIPASQLRLDASWTRRFERGLREIVEGLGLPTEGQVTAVLQKLVVYEEGQFFARHRDSQKNPGTAATLVVVLPSRYRGGELRVSHGGETVVVSNAKDAGADYVSFVGFFADCPHETLPVASGHRVVLSYALEVEPHALPETRGGAADLEQSLRAYFAADEEWLVYVLDHQYTEQSIDWARLKHDDRVRASALLAAAERIDCACFLALAQTHEVREYTGDDDDDDDDDDAGAIDDGLAERCLPSPPIDRNDDPVDDDSPFGASASPSADLGGAILELELTLTGWVDDAGRPCGGSERVAYRSSVVVTCDLDQRVAHETAAEPWTGNEGGTSEKWYHQAVVVVVPRAGDVFAEIVGDAS